jgi:hypothetical protein
MRYERGQIAGVADMGKMPEWAVHKLHEYSSKLDELSANGSNEKANAAIVENAVVSTAVNEATITDKKTGTPAKKPTLQEKLGAAKEKTRGIASGNETSSFAKKERHRKEATVSNSLKKRDERG